jgi:asparagine synthase (glutamine-hydrolysing)
MSMQFGRWNFDGTPISADSLQRAEAILAPYGPDGRGSYSEPGLALLYRAFHSTLESREEKQPYILPSSAVVTWDGRLDNRAELIRDLRCDLAPGSPDVAIVAESFRQWGTACFAKLVGDWAASIWVPGVRTLYLAKDVVGVRPLYYRLERDSITWCTILDPLVLLAKQSFALDEEYIAGWLSLFPAAHLTPYVGVHAVPASFFALVRAGRVSRQRYWDFNSSKTIRYRTDVEYEEHFRTAFAESVRRRLRSNHPIAAELSGGMDSSSIVCMADAIIGQGKADANLMTLSFFDDSEPNWDERPYASKVEEKRGRAGRHIELGGHNPFKFDLREGFAVTPDSCGDGSHSTVVGELAEHLDKEGIRVVLSGIGGDEVMGGVPTPEPELADLLVSGRFLSFARQLKIWALNKRKPWIRLFLDTITPFLPVSLGTQDQKRPASWLGSAFVKRNRAALRAYEARYRFFGSMPSFQGNLRALDALRRQLASVSTPVGPCYERRYPFLDRDLLEFLYAIPREQFVRPGQRRSLMRRALAGIVPAEVLNRKRKAFVVQAPVTCISAEFDALRELSGQMVLGRFGIVAPEMFLEVLERVRRGADISIIPIMRTLLVEYWLQNLARCRMFEISYFKTLGIQEPLPHQVQKRAART